MEEQRSNTASTPQQDDEWPPYDPDYHFIRYIEGGEFRPERPPWSRLRKLLKVLRLRP